MTDISYWYLFGTCMLVYMTWQDYRNNMNIDERLNFLMYGISISLTSHIHHSLSYIILVIIVVILLGMFLRWKKYFGDADVQAMTWIFYGFAIIGLPVLTFFFLAIGAFTIFYELGKKYILRVSYPTPYMGIILLSFIFVAFIYGGY